MNKSEVISVFFAVLCMGLVLGLTSEVHDVRTKRLAAAMSDIARVPSVVLVAGSGEYKGVVANMMFLNASNFIGRKLMERSQPSADEWHQFYLLLDRITELDGRFLDPYVFAEMMLAWQARMYDEAELLLKKAMIYRQDDWRMPYYIGFNYFYFQKKNTAGARYIMKAANIKGCPHYLANLATRLAFYGERSKTALLFLKQMLAENKQVALTPELKKHFDALEGAALIEDAALSFKQQHSASAKTIDDLLKSGLLGEIPHEPYGGQWQLYPNGRVDSSSKFISVVK